MRKNQWLKDRIAALGKTQRALAKALAGKGALRPATVTDIIDGDRDVGVSEIPIIADFLEWPETEIIDNLLGRKVRPRAASLEHEIISTFRSLPPTEQESVVRAFKAWVAASPFPEASSSPSAAANTPDSSRTFSKSSRRRRA